MLKSYDDVSSDTYNLEHNEEKDKIILMIKITITVKS